jgi:hypothetical protein
MDLECSLESARASLLAYVLLHRNGAVPRQRLAFLLVGFDGVSRTVFLGGSAVPSVSLSRVSWLR